MVDETDGLSFAEVEELKNLLILRFMDGGGWDWDWATDQFRANRRDWRRGERTGRSVSSRSRPRLTGSTDPAPFLMTPSSGAGYKV